MQFLNFIIPTILQSYIIVLLLQIWMKWVRSDFCNPFSQFIINTTQLIVGPLRRFVPSIGAIDTATLLVAYILTLSNIFFVMLATHTIDLIRITVLPISSLIQLLTYSGKLVFWIILIRATLSWISQGRSPVNYILMQLTEPLISPIRRILPSMFGLDFSAVIVMIILIALNYLRLDILLLIDPTSTGTLASISYLMQN